MDTISIKARIRKESGKKSSHALRRNGEVPCIMYGGADSEKLSVEAKQLSKALSGEHGRRVILQLDIEGKSEKHNTILKELQYHPIRDHLIHADFLEIDLTKPISEALPVMPQGEAVGVKINGGVLKVHRRQLTVLGLPDKVPSEIFADITSLDIGDSLTIGDIDLPEGITISDPKDTVVLSVGMPKAVKEEEEAVAEGEEAAAEEGAPAGEAAESGDKKDEKKEKKKEKE